MQAKLDCIRSTGCSENVLCVRNSTVTEKSHVVMVTFTFCGAVMWDLLTTESQKIIYWKIWEFLEKMTWCLFLVNIAAFSKSLPVPVLVRRLENTLVEHLMFPLCNKILLKNFCRFYLPSSCHPREAILNKIRMLFKHYWCHRLFLLLGLWCSLFSNNMGPTN